MRENYVFLTLATLLSLMVVFSAAPGFSQALDGVPHLISYQGRLLDSDENPVSDGEYEVTFRIWRDSLSTSPTDRPWISPSCTVLVVNGLFNWQLGSKENIPPWTMNNYADLWLGIQVANDAEITPRTRLCSAPYAYKAWQSDYAEYADSAGVVVSSIGESGEFDGEVSSDMVEDAGANTVFNFVSPLATVEKPHMLVSVVLKGPANGLVEGAAIKALIDVKGSAGNWTGFDITVSKYSDGLSIADTSPVYVTWMALRP
jgi:hypothetical protein